MSTEVFKAKSRVELVELAEQDRASVAGESGGLCRENQSVSQVGSSKVSTQEIERYAKLCLICHIMLEQLICQVIHA